MAYFILDVSTPATSGGVNFLARQLMKAHLINGRETIPEEF